MNPPFENNQDIKHIQHAFTLLKPGGRIVAIMANRAGQNRAKEFFDFVGNHGYYESNPEGAFKSAFKPTGVNTITVVLDKEQEEKIPDIKAEKTFKSAADSTNQELISYFEAQKKDFETNAAKSLIWWVTQKNNYNDDQNTKIVIDIVKKYIEKNNNALIEYKSKLPGADSNLKEIFNERIFDIEAYQEVLRRYEQWQSKYKYKVGDNVIYRGQAYAIGFENNTVTGWPGTYRLQNSKGEQVNFIDPEELEFAEAETNIKTDIKARIDALKIAFDVLQDNTIKNRIDALEISLSLI
jgi:hypothetical protein